jgi:hypothetical protein
VIATGGITGEITGLKSCQLENQGVIIVVAQSLRVAIAGWILTVFG